MITAEDRYEKTWNGYLDLLTKKPNASLASFVKSKSVYYSGMTSWLSRHGLSVHDAKERIKKCQRKSLSSGPVSHNTGPMFLPVTPEEPVPDIFPVDSGILSGVSLAFPDGTIVNIKRGSAKALVSFLSLYRKGGVPCLG